MFKVITQTTDFIVVAKSANTNFHDEGDIGTGLFAQVKALLAKTTPDIELYPVHRLDKMTSGLIIFATNLASAQVFSQLFESHSIEKYYLAISDKKPNKKQGLLKGDMEKSRRGMYKLMRTTNNPAITQFFSYPLADGLRLFLLKPHSGKTHQIRVALSSIGSPILGDPLYYPNAQAQKVDRGYLHAYALRFNYLNEQYEFTLPADEGEFYLDKKSLEKLNELGHPWLLNWPNMGK
jgi:tRNA pseudouridine32 synthase/23S rRNA pseudouridine746 synthase